MIYRSPDILPDKFSKPSVFIAGGISDCPDWQAELITKLNSSTWDIVNPRRVGGFDKTGESAEEQITWEHNALSLVDVFLFWFPKETLCPITLFELGMALERSATRSTIVIVGWHKEYQRAFDLDIQIKLAKLKYPNASIHSLGEGWDNFSSMVTEALS